MKQLNFLSKSGSQSGSHRVVTLASTVGSPSAHRRGAMLKLLSVLAIILTIGVGQMWGVDLTFDFEDNSAHRTSGSNSYAAGPQIYTQHSCSISCTYMDAITSGSPLTGSANAMGRIAKNTTNSPVLKIGPIDLSNTTITGISYNVKGVGAMAQKCAYSTNGTSWTDVVSINGGSMPTSKTSKSSSTLSVSGTSTFYVRITTSVTSSTTSNRDVQIDDVTITYTPNPSLTCATTSLSFSATSGSTDSKNFTFSGANLTANAAISFSGTNASLFSASPNNVSKGTGTITNQSVTVTYSPTDAGNHSATLTITSGSATKSITLTGEATAAPSCTNEITITKGTPSNGSFAMTPTGNVCVDEGNASVTISNINPTSGYRFKEITSSGGGTIDNSAKTVTNISANTTINVVFEVIPPATVSFSTGAGNSAQANITEVSAGAGITLPSAPSTIKCSGDGWVFAGWSETNVSSETTTAPTLLAAGTSYHPVANCTLYAVYKQEAGSGTTTQNYTITFDDNSSDATSDISDDDFLDYITTNADKVSAVPDITKCYKGATGLKLSSQKYNGSFTITLAESTPITKVVLNTKKKGTAQGAAYGVTVGSTAFSTTSTISTDYVDIEFTGTKTSTTSLTISSTSTTSEGTSADGRVAWLQSFTIYYEASAITYNYLSAPTCCTPLGQINGSVNLSNADCDAGELKATWKTNSEGIAGIASQVLHVYKASDDSEVTAKKITGITASTENQTQTISGLDNCTEYYVRIENVSAGSTYCDDGWAGDKSANATTKGYSYSFTLTDGHVTKTAGTARETTCDGDIDYTFAAISGWVLPTSISVTNAGDKNDNWTWDSSTGELIIFAEGVTGNVSVIITATAAPCTPLVMSGVTVSGKDYPYDAVTLSWTAVEHADGYTVEIYDGETKIEDDGLDGGAESYTLTTTLAANKTYSYKVKATSETPATYCESNWATDNFTTNDYPAATLTLHDANGSSDFAGSHKLFDVVELPSTAAACSKTFMGWSADENRSIAPEFAKSANYMLNAISQDLYAVYADETREKTAGTPVNFAGTGGKAALLAIEGVSDGETLGSDYAAGNSPYLTKFDNSDDYIQFDLDYAPTSVYFSYKMIGGDKTSTMTIKECETANGTYTDVQAFTISGAQNSTGTFTTSNSFSQKHVRMVFTKGSNIGVGAITVNGYIAGDPSYSSYTTTCVATPVAEASPANLNNIDAVGASGTITMSYEHVNTANVAVGLFNDEACTEAFSGGWLTASLDNSKNITYTIAENTSYNDARSAYIKLTAPQTSGATDPAIVKIPVSQLKKAAVFASLQDLVAADVNSNTDVTVSFENVPIKEFYYYPDNSSEDNRKGIVFNIQKAGNDIKIYFSTAVPAAWTAGGKVSGTLTDCPWKTYSSAWQLAPKSGWAWNNLSYTAPPVIDRVEIRGTASKTTYIDGQAFKPEGLSVIAVYDNDDEEDVTEYTSWTYSPEILSTSDTQVTVTAEYNSKSNNKIVTGLTVNPIPNKTIAEFIAAGGTRCYLEGIVSNYTNTTKGYFDLTDASGTLYIYGCTSPSSFAAGDKVRVIAETYEYYQSTTHEAKNVVYVSKVSPVAITITDAGSLSVEKDQTLTISATTDPEGAVANITYNVKAGSEDYASIEDNVVTGLAKGTATIIASIPAGEGYLANSVEFEVDVVEYFSITYEENGGSTVADVAKALALPNPLPETTKENYTFNGWFTTSTFDAETEAVAGAELTENVTLYAKWTEIPVGARTYTSNVTLVGGGTSHEDANVVINAESYPAEKAGASKNTGTISITVPAGTNAVHFHGFAWSGKSVTVGVEASPAVTNLSASSFDLAGDAAGSGSNPYSISSNPVNHYKFFTFDAVEEATTFTFSYSSGSDYRFILYGVNAIYPEITLSPASYDFENVRANQTKQQVFTITPNENVSGTLSASITNDANSKYSVSSIVNNQVTVTFDPAGASSGTFTAKLRVAASNASVTADLSGTAIAAEAPEIVVNKNAVAFGRVNPNAEVSEAIAVELLHIDGAASAALSGDDVAKFSLSTNSLSENGNIVITPVTTENGIFSATLTLSAADADDVEIPLSITVANKWAVMYTSNVTLTTTGGTSANTAKVKVNGEATQYDAIKAGTGSVYGAVVVTVPAKTQALHLHAAAWKGETVTLNITGASPSSLALTADDGMNSNSPFTLSNSPIGQAFDLTVPYSETATAITFTADNSTNQSGKRFVIYGVNEEGGIHELPAGNVDETAIPDEVNMVVGEDQTWTVNNDKTVGDLYMKDGAIIANNAKIEANDLYFKAKAGKSNQIFDLSKITVEGSLYYDFQLCDECEGNVVEADYWYSISVPFDVDLNSGVFQVGGTTPLVNRSDFEVWEYDPQKRADTQSNGWKRSSDNMMHAGKAYLIGFNPGQPNIIRLKAAAGWKTNLFSGTSMSVTKTAEIASAGDHDNWNGLANPTGRYIDVDTKTTVFNNNTHLWDSYDPAALNFNFVVGTAFFVQSASAITIGNTDHGNYRAPKREGANESKCAYAVRITRNEATSFDNQIIVRASEDATSEYEQGHDMLTMNDATSKKAALLWTKNYGGKRLAIEEAPFVGDKASYELGIYAPANGTYFISVAEAKDNADLYLTYEGSIIWNLSAGAYELELGKGATNEYGLMMVRKAPQVTTGVENVQGDKTQCTKVILNDHVYILRDAQLYDVTGKAVK